VQQLILPRPGVGPKLNIGWTEAIICVAIVLACAGASVPTFQKGICESPTAKARQDLDTIRNAIVLHDAQNRPLTGTSFRPLLGRYLQEIPRDPWGNDYVLAADAGLILTWGADGKPGGIEEDDDLIVQFKPALDVE
jgi:hypothetical protein